MTPKTRQEKKDHLTERNIDFENKPSWLGVTFAGSSLKSCVKRNKSQVVLKILWEAKMPKESDKER